MARSSVDRPPEDAAPEGPAAGAPLRRPLDVSSTVRRTRADGTLVYGYPERAGRPPVSVLRFDPDTSHAGLPPGHRHAHDFLVLVLVEQGEGAFVVDGVERPLRAGDLHAVSPGQSLGGATASELVRCLAWSVAFTPDAVPALAAVSPLAWTRHPLLALFAPGAGHAVLPAPARADWSRWFAELGEEVADPARLGSREAVTALLTRLLVAAARLAPHAPTAADPLVDKVFEQIEATFAGPVSAGDVARALGYTPGHLTTVVRQRTGRPLLEWLTERRMIEIRRLLRETDLPLGVVAARTGLRDATYLVRRFRQRYGTTPERWRREQRVAGRAAAQAAVAVSRRPGRGGRW